MLRKKPSKAPFLQRKLTEQQCDRLAGWVYRVFFDSEYRRAWHSVLDALWLRGPGLKISIEGMPTSFLRERFVQFKGDPQGAFLRTGRKKLTAFLKSFFLKRGLTYADRKLLRLMGHPGVGIQNRVRFSLHTCRNNHPCKQGIAAQIHFPFFRTMRNPQFKRISPSRGVISAEKRKFGRADASRIQGIGRGWRGLWAWRWLLR
jgi:hypothetical protein